MQAATKKVTVEPNVPLTAHQTVHNQIPPGNKTMDIEVVIDFVVSHEHTILLGPEVQ